MKLNNRQKKILSLLLDKYERSKTYTNSNQVNQSFSIEPTRVFEAYYNDFVNLDEIKDFEHEIQELVALDLIYTTRLQGGYGKLFANIDKMDSYYTILNRDSKASIIEEQLAYYMNYHSTSKVADCLIQDATQRLQAGKKAEYDLDTTKHLISLLEVIEGNQSEILERELSIACLHDSKLFEKNYRTKVCNLLKKYGELGDLLEGIEDKREQEKVLLAEYHIDSNPSYVYFKGEANIIYQDGKVLIVDDHHPLAIPSTSIEDIARIEIKESKFMTVENMSSFNRVNDPSFFYLYLAGYHNSSRQNLIKHIVESNPSVELYHFGDLDPDGFYILETLNRKTQLYFEAYKMSLDKLILYKEYSKPLEKNDIIKANHLLEQGKYTDILTYMLENNCKLEQEIISYLERG